MRLVILRAACRACKMGSEDLFHRPFSSTLSSYCFFAYHPSLLEEIHFSDVRNDPSRTGMRHLVASHFPSLQFWPASKIVRVVLVLRRKVSMNSLATNPLQATVPVILLLFRPSESPFASLSSLFGWVRHFVVSLIFVLIFIGSS